VEQQVTCAWQQQAHSAQEAPIAAPFAGANTHASANSERLKPLAEALSAAALREGEKSLIMCCVHEALRLRSQGVQHPPLTSLLSLVEDGGAGHEESHVSLYSHTVPFLPCKVVVIPDCTALPNYECRENNLILCRYCSPKSCRTSAAPWCIYSIT
jgi:hypothetical protein